MLDKLQRGTGKLKVEKRHCERKKSVKVEGSNKGRGTILP